MNVSMFVICLMSKDKVFHADDAAIVNRLSLIPESWPIIILHLNLKGEASPSIYADWVNGGWF